MNFPTLDPSEWLALALVLVTIFYAWRTNSMVEEMRTTRKQALMPKLALGVDALGPTYFLHVLRNAGPGPALDVRVELIFEDTGGNVIDRRAWRSPLFVSGERREFLAPKDAAGRDIHPSGLGRVRVVGTAKDALGDKINVAESFDDPAGWQDVLFAADELWQDEPLDIIAKALKDTAKHLGSVAETLGKR